MKLAVSIFEEVHKKKIIFYRIFKLNSSNFEQIFLIVDNINSKSVKKLNIKFSHLFTEFI